MLEAMRKWLNIFLLLAIFFFFSVGCSGASKGTKIRCQKCGGLLPATGGEKNSESMRELQEY
jgi:hypothetical protein